MRWNLRQRMTLLAVTGCVTATLWSSCLLGDEPPAADSKVIAAEVDHRIEAELTASNVQPAGLANDEDFLRRVSFDIVGTLPTAKEVTLFGLDPDPEKRAKLVDRLLASDEYALNWAMYWRDVIFLRATNEFARIAIPPFETWMTKQLQENVGWNKIAQSLITGVGEISEHGEAAFVFAQQGNAEEIAGEASRIFSGIQLQCANCHDHPTDKWTRDQFHALAAFFPRVSIQRRQAMPPAFTVAAFNAQAGGGRALQQILQDADLIVQRFDTDNDGKLSKAEAAGSALAPPFDRLLEFGDDNRDGLLSAKELKSMPIPDMPGRGNAEHYMPDLKQPTDKGRLMTPAFFVTNAKGRTGMEDEDRRALFAKFATSPTNPWFAKSFVNRIWGELLGEGFYMPIDDMGPERKARMGSVLDYLATEFVKHDHDIQWLIRTIANTRTYQRQVRFNEPTENRVPFASAVPARLRADQLMNAVVKVLGVDEGPRHSEGPLRGRRTPREQVEALFGFDPSTPQDELLGNVPQALFLMNLPQISNALKAEGNTRLGQILANNKTDKAAIGELYLAFLARDPSDKELTIAVDYLEKVGNRREAFEDLAWSLLNSSEFLSKR